MTLFPALEQALKRDQEFLSFIVRVGHGSSGRTCAYVCHVDGRWQFPNLFLSSSAHQRSSAHDHLL